MHQMTKDLIHKQCKCANLCFNDVKNGFAKNLRFVSMFFFYSANKFRTALVHQNETIFNVNSILNHNY